jgi:hypothetical protein
MPASHGASGAPRRGVRTAACRNAAPLLFGLSVRVGTTPSGLRSGRRPLVRAPTRETLASLGESSSLSSGGLRCRASSRATAWGPVIETLALDGRENSLAVKLLRQPVASRMMGA